MQITATRTQHNAQRIHKRLRKDPYNVEALFGLAGLLGGNRAERNQKRKVLQRILYLEPHHQSARQMLFEMDRAAIGGDGSRLSLATILPGPSSQEFAEPPLVLRFSLVYRLLIYGFLICGMIASLVLIREGQSLLGVGVLLAFLLALLWHSSVVVELGDSSLSVSHLFGLGSAEFPWSEIHEVRRGFLGQGIRLTSHAGKTISIPSQVQGYPFILDILYQTRPDLFHSTGDLKANQTHPQQSVIMGQTARLSE